MSCSIPPRPPDSVPPGVPPTAAYYFARELGHNVGLVTPLAKYDPTRFTSDYRIHKSEAAHNPFFAGAQDAPMNAKSEHL